MRHLYLIIFSIVFCFLGGNSYAQVAAISGPTTLCPSPGGTTYSDATPGGVWTTSSSIVAVVGSSTGVVYAISPGTTTLSYTVPVLGTATMTISVQNSPAVYSVFGGGIFCYGSSGAGVGLINSSAGINYQLYVGGIPSGITVSGTGAALMFGMFTTPGIYTVVATDAVTGCMANMSGGAAVAVDTSKTISGHSLIITPDSFCGPAHFHIDICASPSGTYKLVSYYGDGTFDTTTLVLGANDIFHPYTASGSYHIKQVLYQGTTATDSVFYTHDYLYCHELPVNFFYDADGDGVYDAGEHAFKSPITVAIDSNGIPVDTLTVISGLYYKAHGLPGTVYGFRVVSTTYGITSPLSGVIYDTVQPFTNTYTAKYFGISCLGVPGFDLVTTQDTRVGRHANLGDLLISNANCTSVDATVTLTFNPAYHMIWGYPTPTSTTSTTATWYFSAVDFSALQTISYFLDVSPGTWFMPGDTIRSSVDVTTTGVGETDTVNNHLTWVDTAKASFDPNDIRATPEGSKILSCQEMEYRVRFENTGNSMAHNIAVLDTLSPYLDAHSLKVQVASHIMNMSLIQDGGYNVVKFDFPDINLLDSSHHGQYDGMVVYKIKTKPGIADGTVINNYAGIFFDDNEAVMTNIAQNVTGIDPITGPSSLCSGSTITLANATKLGVWSSSSTNATVSKGVVTGVSAGTANISYTTATSCATHSATKTITVNTSSAPSVTVSTTANPGNIVCTGESVTLTALPTGGGSVPTFLWNINGINVGTGPVYSFRPASGDAAKVTLSSSNPCATVTTVTSATTTFTLMDPVVPRVTLAADPGIVVNEGTSVTLTASVSGGGAAPAYEWSVNGTPVSGATLPSFTSSAFANGDEVLCTVDNTDACGYNSFNSVVMHVAPDNVQPVQLTNEVALYPNPTSGSFTVKNGVGAQLRIVDMLGREVVSRSLASSSEMVNISSLAAGSYIAQMTMGNGEKKNVRIVKE